MGFLAPSMMKYLASFANSALLWAAFLLAAPAALMGQGPAGAARLTGQVRGPGGVSVPGATIILTEKESGTRKQTWTDEDGNFAFTGVASGTYKLDVSLVGFRDELRDPLAVSADKPVQVDIVLAMALPAPPAGSEMAGRQRAWRNPGSSGNPGNPPNRQAFPQGARERFGSQSTQGGAIEANGMPGEAASGEAGVRFSEGAATAGTGENNAASNGANGSAEANGPSPDMGASAANSFLLSGSVMGAATPGGEGSDFESRRGEFQGGQGPGGPGEGGPGGGGPGAGGGPGGGPGGGFGGGGPGGPGGFGGGGGFGGPGGPGGFGPGGMTLGGRGFAGRRPQINRIRGNINEQFTNSAVYAHPYPLNVAESPLVPSYQERFGVGFGGPLAIPKIYNGKDKTTFFFNYQLQRSKRAIDNFLTVPTSAERAGDFSGLPTIYDPQSNPSGPRTPFSGNQIPMARFDAAALGLLKYIPLPNLPGTVQNFHLQEALPSRNDNVMALINRRIGTKDNANVMYSFNSAHSNSISSFPELTSTTSTRQQNLNLGETHTFNPHSVNMFMFNFNRSRTLILNPFANQQNISQELGIQGVSQNPFDFGLPQIGFTNFAAINDTIPSLTRPQTARLSDFVMLNRGKHNLRLGGELRRVEQNTLTDPNARGTFTFNGYTTSDFTTQGLPVAGTGFDFADFLLGLPQATSVRFGTASNYFRSWVFAGFVQDDWRVRSRLTLNLGLRYEYFQPFMEKFGHLSDLQIGPGFSTAGVVTGQSPDGLPSSLIHSDPYNFAPRIGIAYRPSTKRRMTVRAGYGLFYDSSIYSRLTPHLADQPPFAQASTLLTSPQQVLTLENGFPTVGPGVLTNTYAVDPNFRTPYGQNWNLAVEGEVARDLILSVGYVGTKGTMLDLLLGPNRTGSAQGNLSLHNAQQFTYETSGATSIYQGLQVILRRQFHNGFSMNAYYTFSKSIDDAASVGGSGTNTVAQNTFDLAAERGLSVFDVRHRLLINHTYEFPFGQRKRFLSHGGPVAGVFGDWRLSGVASIQSGTPLTASVRGNQSSGGGIGAYFSGRAEATGLPVSLPASQRSTLDYFNTAAFTLPPAGEFGNAGRNTIEGPGSINFNMALGRILTISETKGLRLDFRFEANNIFNHPNYAGVAAIVDATNYGRVTSVGGMRTLDFAMRLRF